MAVLVAGPRWAGVSSLVAALRERMPGVVVTEACDQPAAVVFVVSAVAPITDSDRDLIHRVSGHADLVVGAVSKIDAHRRWREVLSANRELLGERADRYRDVPWIGVASAPEFGVPNVDELVSVLTGGLADPDLARRNMLRVNDIRAANLRESRSEIVRSRRPAAPAVRMGLQEARLRLIFGVRARCARISSGLREAACQAPRGGAAEFEARVHSAAEEFVDEVDDEINGELDAIASRLSLSAPGAEGPPSVPELTDPRWRTDRLQRRLTAVLGAGFGVGVALGAGRLIVGAFDGFFDGFEVAGWTAGGLLGVLAAVWVIGARALLQYRAALDRWTGEVVVALRARGEEMVSGRLLATEIAFAELLARRDEALAARIALIDAELRRLARSS
jgi:hypothetical protein